MKRTLDTQRGQVIILFVLALVGLLAFAGLAIDGAMVYSDRRVAQSSADSAALAGAGAAGNTMQLRNINYFVDDKNDFNCDEFTVAGSKMNAVRLDAIDAALQRAGANGFTIDDDITDKNGVVIRCYDDKNPGKPEPEGNPPQPVLSWEDYFLEVEVQITSQTNTSFLHLVFSEVLQNTVTSVTRIYPSTTYAYGNAIYSTDDVNCTANGNAPGGTILGGGIIINITNGGMHSDSCLNGNGVNQVTGGASITYITEYDAPTATGSFVNPAPKPVSEPWPLHPAPVPDCSAVEANMGQVKNGGAITPGNYDSISVGNNDPELVMAPGLYCVSGDFTISGAASSSGGVTIYMQRKQQGHDLVNTNFVANGSAEVRLYAPKNNETPVNGALTGILIRYADDNLGNISLLGDGVGEFGGTIYAPNNLIEVGGNTGVHPTYSTELIGDTVFVHGNTTININWDSDYLATKAPWLELNK